MPIPSASSVARSNSPSRSAPDHAQSCGTRAQGAKIRHYEAGVSGLLFAPIHPQHWNRRLGRDSFHIAGYVSIENNLTGDKYSRWFESGQFIGDQSVERFGPAKIR